MLRVARKPVSNKVYCKKVFSCPGVFVTTHYTLGVSERFHSKHVNMVTYTVPHLSVWKL